ncbi:MAG: Holliday junction resolvase RuvX [Deltaproteobacteria bacterium]|nr:Holliday junction resolvase RuvX [Deltaproteobacteria bacterium]
MKTLAIDPGKARTGLAACDELELTTRLLPVLEKSQEQALVEALLSLIEKEGFERVIVGNPLHMDGAISLGSQRAQKLAERLKKALLQKKWSGSVLLYDERLTSFEAETRLREKGISKKKAKGFLDSLAALVLLEDYLKNQ